MRTIVPKALAKLIYPSGAAGEQLNRETEEVSLRGGAAVMLESEKRAGAACATGTSRSQRPWLA